MSELDDPGFDVHEFAEQLGYTDELGRHDMSDPNIERATTKASRGLSRLAWCPVAPGKNGN